jgi:hypothetical protein
MRQSMPDNANALRVELSSRIYAETGMRHLTYIIHAEILC